MTFDKSAGALGSLRKIRILDELKIPQINSLQSFKLFPFRNLS